MNVALPALVVFIVLLPGFIARSRIKRAERLSLDFSPFGQVATEAVLWAGGLHGLWLGLIQLLSPYTFKASSAVQLLAADPKAQLAALQEVAQQMPALAAYFASLLAFAYLGPSVVRWTITARRLDRAGAPLSGLFRFSRAPWYYLLSGADFAAHERPDLIAVSAVVSLAGQPHVFKGVLDDYFVDSEGQLERLILQHVMRRPLSADKVTTDPAGNATTAEERFYPVDGDYFVLRYSEAITLNIEYIKLAEEGSSAAG